MFNCWLVLIWCFHSQKQRAWTMSLLALACLSLAAKIDEPKVPLCLDLQVNSFDLMQSSLNMLSQISLITLWWLVYLVVFFQVGESKYVFESETIQKMELMVLNKLGWRMQAITPFSFIDYFLSKISDDETTIGASILKSVQLILSAARGNFLFVFLSNSLQQCLIMIVRNKRW